MKSKKFISLITTLALTTTIALNSSTLSALGKDVSTDELKQVLKSEVEAKILNQTKYIKGNSLTEKVVNENGSSSNLEEEIRVIVQLEDTPAIKDNSAEYNDSIKVKEEEIKSSQNDVIVKVEAITGTTVKRSFGYLVNGFSINTKRKYIDKLRAVEGVKSVTEVKSFKPDMEFAKKITGATDVWKDLGYKGEGMVVSIIDTGIDYTHKDLQKIDTSKIKIDESKAKTDMDKLGYGKHFTDKVPYGYNYADGNDNVIDDGSQHGMHVAGIVAANGDENETNSFNAVKGVAPEAQLLAMKVFTNNPNTESAWDDDILAAMEDSVKLGADVINMSLGGGPGFSTDEDPENIAVKNATDAGVICVISAGNSQTSTTTSSSGQPMNQIGIKDTATVGSPSTAKGALSVASMENTRTVLSQVTYESKNGTKNKVFFSNVEGSKLDSLENYHEIVDCGRGVVQDGQDDFGGKDLTGKIALIERGVTTFQSKYDNAIKHNASGVIIYNHAAGGNLPMGMSVSNITSPVFSLGRQDALNIKNAIECGDKEYKFSSDGSVSDIENTDINDMSQFSSWGATPDLEFKPEITAPGGDIYSLANNNSYQIMSGTSMAAPHTAGSEALILQGVKNNPNLKGLSGKDLVSFAKNTAMNTAKIMTDKYDSTGTIPYSTRRQGAGVVQIENAIKNNVTITYKDGKAAAALKEIDKNTTFTLKLKNYSSKDITYDLGKEKAYGEVIDDNGYIHEVELGGSEVSFDKEKVQVKANSTAEITVTLNVGDKIATENFVEGYIHFKSEDSNEPSLSVPFMGFYGDWNKDSIVDLPNYTDEKNSKIGTTGLATEVNGKIGYLGAVVNNSIMQIDKNKVAFSPNGDGLKDNLLPALYMLRNSKEVKAQVIDKDGNVVKDLYVSPKLVKNTLEDYTSGKGNATYLSGATWDGTVYNSSTGKNEKAEDGEYSIKITNSMELEGSKEQELNLPIKLDTKEPEFKIKDIQTYKDSSEKTHYKLSWTGKDNDGGSGIDGTFAVSINGKIQTLKESDITEVNGIYSAEISFNEGEVNSVELVGIDNAGNYGVTSSNLKAENLKTIAFSRLEDGLVIGNGDLTDGKFVIKGTAGNDLGKLIVNDKKIEIEDNYFEVPVDVKEGENSIKVYAEDKDKKLVLDKVYKVILDTSKPEVAVYPNIGEESPYYTTENDTIKLNISVEDNTEVKGSITSGDSNIPLNIIDRKATTDVKLKDGLNLIKLSVSDKAGNTTVKDMIVVKGDSTDKLSVTIDNLSFAQFIQPAEVKDGIYKIKGHVNKNAKVLKINDQNIKINDDLTFTYDFALKNGGNLLKIYAEDADGKVVANYAYKSYYDSTSPKLVTNLPLIREDGNIYTNNSIFNINGKITDNMFGYSLYVNGDCLIHFDNNPISDEKLLEKNFSKNITLNDGLNHVNLLAQDEFGNKVSDDIKVVLDKVAPNAPKINVTSEPYKYKSTKVEITTDEKQIDRIEYSFDGKNYIKYDGKIEIGASTSIYARVVDYAGNVSGASAVGIDLDTTAPVVTVSGISGGQTYYKPVVPVVDVNDKESKLIVLLNGKEYKGEELNVEGDYTLEAYAIDKAGNKSNVVKQSFKLSQNSYDDINGDFEDTITHNSIKPSGDNPYIYEAIRSNDFKAIIDDTSKEVDIISPNTKVILPTKVLSLSSGKVTFNQSIYAYEDILKFKAVNRLIDLSLVDSDGKLIKDFKGNKVKVSVKLTDEELKNLDKSKLTAYYYDESVKEWKEIGGEFSNDTSTFTFETTKFSKFVIGEKVSSNNPVPEKIVNSSSNEVEINTNGLTEKTGDKTTLGAILALVFMAIVSGGALFITGRKKNSN
ncbi:S8 family serine peptidase [Clostridium sp. SHJSY1]|uniref:S8 family serine peptidase n=1 Tax=Clostridium sp. SHJSY1 TaxID=2942483 RepID=UPI002874A60D|nr:S8 family serine peptidase [Clostridium sp. SHJSY1]MDS0528306.1 S8 family serine peptidase [Clostridium sp. SHJSY1]